MAKPPGSPKGRLALRINTIRQVHVYVSMIVAPLLVFWTITGTLQVFRIPDQHPASLLAKLASVHKNATFAAKAPPVAGGRGGGPGRAGPARGGGQPKPPQKPATLIFRGYEAAASIALTVSTFLGVWMGIAYHRRKGLMWAMLALGVAIPVALLAAAV